MPNARIMIVEDESIVSKNIQSRLRKLGYKVPTVVSSGEDAIKSVAKVRPDLVLMDIVLKGKTDGIETATHIRENHSIPVVYLTAYADENTIDRAKKTEPFGYVLKPFEIKVLQSAIEIALYKHEMESKLMKKKSRIVSTLKGIGYAVLATDKAGRITYMNPLSEELSGCDKEDAFGMNLKDVFNVVNGDTRTQIEDLARMAIQQMSVVDHPRHLSLINRHGNEQKVYIKASPMRNEREEVIGSVIVLRKITGRKKGEEIVSSVRNKNEKISLVVLSSSTLFRKGIEKVLDPEREIEIVNLASSVSEIITIVEQKPPDVLFIDTDLDELQLDELHKLIRNVSDYTKVLLSLSTLDEKLILNAFSSGVLGFLTKTSNKKKLIQAIKYVSRGEIWGKMRIIRKILKRSLIAENNKSITVKRNLTKKEEGIATLAVQGLSNKNIAQKLYVKESTVKTHLNNMFKKLGVKNRLQLSIKFQS